MKRLPRYPKLPATLLARLAVDVGHKGRGLGEFLLMHALSRSLTQTQEVASLAVVVAIMRAQPSTAGRLPDTWRPAARR